MSAFKKCFSLGHIAGYINAELRGNADAQITGIATLEKAVEGEITFLANRIYEKYLPETKASAVILSRDASDKCSTNVLVMDNPYLGYALASQLYGWRDESAPKRATTAQIHPDAEVHPSATVQEFAVIAAGAEIAEDTWIGPGCYVGNHSSVGRRTRLYANVSLYHNVTVGADCVLHSGVVLGSDGFGFAPHAKGFEKIEQLGSVVINDRVEIGANTTVDRGALDNTIIEDGVKLDNQIQIAHNVRIGANTVIAACVGVSGSSKIGRNCMIGGGVGIAGHLDIVDNVQVTGMTLVSHSIKEPGVYSSGTAVEPNSVWRKNVARFRQLDRLARRVISLERQKKS